MPLRISPARYGAVGHLVGRGAFVCVLLLPVALLHARALAEILIAAIDLLFVVHCLATRDTAWLRRPFTVAAAGWWLWLALCSAIGSGGLLPGLLALRLPLLSLAVGEWVLARDCVASLPPRRRQHMLWLMLAASLFWIGLTSWEQYLTGSNPFGQGRWMDGALTGPFNKPRAGPAFILLFFPVILPAVMQCLGAASSARRLAGLALAAAGVSTMLLIGQRMPSVLMLAGLAVTALLLPRLRTAVLAACGAGALLLAALPWVSPATNDKLVVHFASQLRHFADSAYGLIFVRAYAVAEQHPWIGQGFDGFRRRCSDGSNMHGIEWLGIQTGQLNGGMGGCNLHPHNYYLEAADNAGLPGLALFAAMVLTALLRLGAGLWRQPDPARTGLFVAALLALWPVASTSAFTSMPNGGWVFLLIGTGFSLASHGGDSRADDSRGERTRTRPV